MFIRKLHNKKTGKTNIQVIDKSSGRYKVVKSFGGSNDIQKIKDLTTKARRWLDQLQGLQPFDFTNEQQVFEHFLSNINRLQFVGLELLLGRIFDQIGFDQIQEPVFRQLVLYRVAFPGSKLKTTEYLQRYAGLSWNEDQVYRYLDKLFHHQSERVQSISYAHSKHILGEDVKVVFYDVTTLYFEIDREDELRKTGFSKEGKHQKPQIVLGLLVSSNAYPLAYEIFEGNKFEGHTMLPVIEAFKEKFNLNKLIVVADAGLMSKANIDQLKDNGYEFILGARLKKEPDWVKQRLFGLDLDDGQSAIIDKEGIKLVVCWSQKRAKKDAYNRQKGLKKLEKQIKSKKLTKAHINNRGYNKYLKLDGQISVSIDYQKFKEDTKWDGLKGYVTNARLKKEQIITNYTNLWHIEKAFRISKTDLKIRPIYHRLNRRIQAHICICFAAYKVYKELERQLKVKQTQMSPRKAIEIAENIFQITVQAPNSGKEMS
ncbi:MAG: IS1634 family transposase, partial [Balneolaceae bacterium]